MKLDWAAFWLSLAIIYGIDAAVFCRGYDTFFFKHKTAIELEGQRHRLGLETNPPREPGG